MEKKVEKSVGEEFCEALYNILYDACTKAMTNKPEMDKDEIYESEYFFNNFEIYTDKLGFLRKIYDMYDYINPDLVGYAITKDPDDFEISFLPNETLIPLKDKIDRQILWNVSEFNDEDLPVDMNIAEILTKFCNYVVEFCPNISYLEKDNPNRNMLIDNFLKENGFAESSKKMMEEDVK